VTDTDAIAAVLTGHGEVRHAVVAAHDAGGCRLIAYVVGKGSARPRASDLRSFLSSHAPEALVPEAFVLLDELPMRADGTVDLQSLPVPRAPRQDLDAPYVPPRNPAEQTLAEIWARVLKLDEVGVDDHFMELGGDSLAAVALIGELQDRFGIEVPVWSIFERPTITAMVEQLWPLSSPRTSQHSAPIE